DPAGARHLGCGRRARRCKRRRSRQGRGGRGKERSAAQTSHGTRSVKRCEVYHGTRAAHVQNLFPSSPCLRYRHSNALFKLGAHGTGNQAGERPMLAAAVKAPPQFFPPPFRWVLLKPSALALALIVLTPTALHRLLVWLTTAGADWAETVFGVSAHAP